MSQARKTRKPVPTQALTIPPSIAVAPEIKKASDGWMLQMSGLSTVMSTEGRLIGLVVNDVEEYDRTEQSLTTGRAFEKLFLRANEKSEEQKQMERDLAGVKKFIAGLNKMHRDALGKFKRDERARVEEEARVEAQAAFDRLEREKVAEATRLEQLAKKAKGQEKKDLKAQAVEVREEETQSVDSAVQEAGREATSDLRGSTPKLWHAELDDLNKLVEAAFNNPSFLVYLQIDSVMCNAQARAKKSVDIGIPGVVGVSEDSYR